MAGAVIGEVGVSLFVVGAAFRENLGNSRSAKRCIFPYKMRRQEGTSTVSEAAVARCRFHGRIISSDSVRIVCILAEAMQGFLACALQVRISGPAQYLARFYLLRATFHM